MADELDAAIARMQDALNQGQLALARDRFNQIELPTFTDVTRPGAVSGLTGMLMDRPDLYGAYAGRNTIDSLTNISNMAGGFADDPRFGAFAGKNTLAGYNQQFTEQNANNQRIQAQREFDAQRELETGVPYINGAPAPTWLKGYTDWARQYMAQNNGQMPTGPAFNQAFLGQSPTGDLYDNNGRVVNPQTQSQIQQGDDAMQAARGGPLDQALGRFSSQATVPGVAGGSVNLAGSGIAGSTYGTTPMSEEQRRLMEAGRATDISAQLTSNAQAITNKQVEYQNAVAQGNLELANRTQNELTALNNAKLDLEKQQTTFQQGIDTSKVTGTYNGQDTLEKQNQQNQTALQYSQLAAGLRGPEDLVQYSRTLGGTPGGIRDIVGAALGRYRNAAYGDTAGYTSPATLGGLTNDIVNGGPGGGQRQDLPYRGMQMAPGLGSQAFLQDAQPGQAGVDQMGQARAAQLQNRQLLGNPGQRDLSIEQGVQAAGNPDQWNFQNVDKFNPTQRKMLYSLAEGQGRRIEDIDAVRNRALGRYKGVSTARQTY